MAEPTVRTPRWVWAIILALAATQPLVHLLTAYAPPANAVPTGLHIPDSALFLYSMDMFSSGFHSNYATCQSGVGDASVHFYAVPHLWLYGLLGWVVRLLPGDAFLYYGFANGLGALLYLWVVYRFLLIVAPRHANAAFLLFSLSGGPGGLLYLLTGLAGLHDHPLFETYFYRFGVYDLMEGPHFHPVLYFPRLYYTLSLAGCLGGLSSAIRAVQRNERSPSWGWAAAVCGASFLDARFAVFSFGLLVLYACSQRDVAQPAKWRALLHYGVPAAAGVLLAGALMRLNPATIENHQSAGAMAMWFSPMFVVAWLHGAAVAQPLRQALRGGHTPIRTLLGAGAGYLAAYAVGYFAYQGYYGNLLVGRDGSVAGVVSDWALLGAAAGGLLAWRQDSRREGIPVDSMASHAPWLSLWLVGYTAIALSGFGQGWFLRFGPQRVQVFLWLPLCTLAAMGLAQWPSRWRRGAYAVLLGCGVLSIAVATLAFQSPLGRMAAKGPYPALHAEVMHVSDKDIIQAIGDGTVLAPAPASDIVVRWRGNPVVFGIGSFNLTDRPYGELRAAVETFFAPDTTDEIRREIARDWCVDWVYCPDTWPVDATTRAQLQASTWLEAAAASGDGLLFAVHVD